MYQEYVSLLIVKRKAGICIAIRSQRQEQNKKKEYVSPLIEKRKKAREKR